MFLKQSLVSLISKDVKRVCQLQVVYKFTDYKFVSLQVVSLFKLVPLRKYQYSCDSTTLTTSFKKVQRHDDLIEAHALRQALFIRSTCNNAVHMKGN